MEEKKVVKEGSTPDKMVAELEALKAQVADLQKANNQLQSNNQQIAQLAQKFANENTTLRNTVKQLSSLL